MSRRRVVCGPEVHPYLRQHPGDLLHLRPDPFCRGDMGECPGCGSSLVAPWSDERRAAEGVPTIAEDEAEDAVALAVAS